MKCNHCGYADEYEAKFCPECGKPVENMQQPEVVTETLAPTVEETPSLHNEASEKNPEPLQDITKPEELMAEDKPETPKQPAENSYTNQQEVFLEVPSYKNNDVDLEEPDIEISETLNNIPTTKCPYDQEAQEEQLEAMTYEEHMENQEETSEQQMAPDAKPTPVICPSCGSQVDEDAAFCIKCGERVRQKKYCKYCGTPNEHFEVYCSNCGRDEKGKVKSKFDTPKSFTDKIDLDRIKSQAPTLNKSISKGFIITLVMSVVSSLMLFTKWISVPGLVLIQEAIGYFLESPLALETNYSISGFAHFVLTLNSSLGLEETSFLVIGYSIYAAIGLIILLNIYSAYSSYISGKPGWAMLVSGVCTIVLCIVACLAMISVNNEIASELDYLFEKLIKASFWLYLSGFVGLVGVGISGSEIYKEYEKRK